MPETPSYVGSPIEEMDASELRRVISLAGTAASRAHAEFCNHERVRVRATAYLQQIMKKGEPSAGTVAT